MTIPYGAEFPEESDSGILRRLQIESGRFFLYVSRFEPENNPLEVVRAYEKLAVGRCPLAEETANSQRPTANIPLVMVGSAAYAPELDAELKGHAGSRILFPGAVYEEHTDSQGGTAMAGSSLFPVLVLEVPSQLAPD